MLRKVAHPIVVFASRKGVRKECRPIVDRLRRTGKEAHPIVVFASRKGVRRAARLLRKHAAYRDVAQVVARAVRDHEVAGSSPVIPTNSLINDRGTPPVNPT